MKNFIKLNKITYSIEGYNAKYTNYLKDEAFLEFYNEDIFWLQLMSIDGKYFQLEDFETDYSMNRAYNASIWKDDQIRHITSLSLYKKNTIFLGKGTLEDDDLQEINFEFRLEIKDFSKEWIKL
ncbi:hypothetical protein Fleli_1670 [Bernardetia litoralis DSM 6794]|uniref:Uncharacterized protein n=1 Tax=Bernardetia litoralis (strain ATCC 23117 / DSM 6794 / NBRC 15988 / NCIMB 1366 / Fx l1 / Sio-4) TaxID=880071 RepID=I4AJE5_BERLS|nr:hypothetical protein [Bernardetia litoralis]AFM04080.1 hypothetical protein Fleli_1670 [Bernardetia litoralis DSM 6794]